MISSGMETRKLVFHEFSIAQAGERPDAGDHRNAVALDALQKDFKQAQVEDRLGDGVLGAGLDFVGEAAQFLLDVGHAGVGGHADGEVGAGADRVGADVEAVIQAGARC